jgi:hypothetical protein
MLHENISHCSHRLPACRPEEGVPASIGAFLADTLPEQMSSDPLLGLTFAEIPTSFYMGIRNPNLRFIVLSDLTSRSRHLRFPADKCGVLVRTGHVKDYVHYLQEKRDHLRPRILIGWSVLQPDAYTKELKLIGKDYTNEFGDSLFFVFHQAPDPKTIKLGHYSETVPLWTVKFSASHFERNMEQAILITSQRDEELRKIRFLDDKIEERKAIRRKAAEALDAITKPLPFHLTCFFVPNFYHTSNSKATAPRFTLDPLTPESESEWAETAKECRSIIHRKLNSQGAYPSLKETSKALQEEAEARGYILDLGRIPQLPDKWNENTVELGQNLKVRQSNMAGAFLKLNDRTFEWFNSAEGRPTGVYEALLSRPNLLGRGVQEAAQVLNGLGYKLQTTAELEKRLEKKKRFYKFQESPLHELQGHELVAYYNHGKYVCRQTVVNPKTKKPLWIKSHEYEIVPTWAKMLYAGGSEPIVNEANSIIGMEELSVRLSYLQLKVQTETGSVVISENQCRHADDDIEVIDELGSTPTPTPTSSKGKKAAAWEPMLDEFIEAFGLPNVPTIAELKPDLLRKHVRHLKQRMPDLKSYQVDCCVRNATKKGGILGGTMGSGKTRMIIGTLLLRKHMFNLVIVPPMLVDSWLEHFKLYQLHAEPLLTHDALNTLVKRYKALRGLTPEKKRKQLHAEQEFYVTTPEFLTLGGIGNVVYDEWTATYESKRVVVDPITGEPVLDARGKRQYEKIQQQVTSTRYHSKTEHSKAKIPFGTRHSYGDHIKKCPKCEVKQDDDTFTPKGWCHKCGHRAYSYKGTKQLHGRCLEGHVNPIPKWIFRGGCPDCAHPEIVSLQEEKVEKISLDFINELLEGTKGAHNTVGAKVKSFNAYPAYKRIRGIFGAKAIDEVHLLANFNSQRGMAVFGIKTKETWVASGTIARGYVTDLEASLCHVHGANTPIFPFYPWGNGREGFREQFVTERVKTSVTAKEGKKKQSSSPMPEASNLNRLRRMLNCVTTTVPDSVMEKEWKLPPIKRTYEEIWLKKTNQDKYLQELTNIKSWFSGASDIERHRGALRRLWNLRLICDGEEKEACIEKYVKKWLREKRKFILTASTVAQYRRLCNILERNNVRYLAIDEKIPADRRDEVTAEFADPEIQALVSRTRLVNIGLNTMIHADRLLIASLEYSPDSLRQMEKRICRPGQKSSDLQVIYPVVRMKPKSSVEEKMLKLVLEKELAVKEMLEGKVRWQSAAELLEAAKEKKGAAKVLQDIMSEKETSELDTIFSQNMEEESISPEVAIECPVTPTRKRGRPKKASTSAQTTTTPRKRGRPRKNTDNTATATPRKRGRPRKNPLS